MWMVWGGVGGVAWCGVVWVGGWVGGVVCVEEGGMWVGYVCGGRGYEGGGRGLWGMLNACFCGGGWVGTPAALPPPSSMYLSPPQPSPPHTHTHARMQAHTHTHTPPPPVCNAFAGVVCRPADFGLCELLDPDHTHVSNHNKGNPTTQPPKLCSSSRWVYLGRSGSSRWVCGDLAAAGGSVDIWQ